MSNLENEKVERSKEDEIGDVGIEGSRLELSRVIWVGLLEKERCK